MAPPSALTKTNVIWVHILVIRQLNVGIPVEVTNVIVVQIMTNALQVSFAGTTKSRKSRNFLLLGCVVDGIEHQDGSQWREGCSECQCLNGVTSCQALSCSNCSIMTDTKEARNCCPQCLSGNDSEPPRKCQLLQGLEAKIQEYHNGQKWLSQCQECECLVGKKLKFILSILE